MSRKQNCRGEGPQLYRPTRPRQFEFAAGRHFEDFVGGKFPDRWEDYKPYASKSLALLSLRGLVAAKTPLDAVFLQGRAAGEASSATLRWTPEHLLSLEEAPPVMDYANRLERESWRADMHKAQVPRDEQEEEGEEEQDQLVAVNNRTSDSPPYFPLLRNPMLPAGAAAAAAQPASSSTAPPRGRRASCAIACIVNLCQTERHYRPHDFVRNGVEYFPFPVNGGGSLMSVSHLMQFLELFAFLARRHARKSVLLHCTHGINRTGFIAAMLLAIFEDQDLDAAFEFFYRARGHCVSRDNLVVHGHQLLEQYRSSRALQQYVRRLRSYCDEAPAAVAAGAVARVGPIPRHVGVGSVYTHLLGRHRVMRGGEQMAEEVENGQAELRPLGILDMVDVTEERRRYVDIRFLNGECLEAAAANLNAKSMIPLTRRQLMPFSLLECYDDEALRLWPHKVTVQRL